MIRRKVTELSRYIILCLIREGIVFFFFLLNCIPNSRNQPAERIGHASWHFLSHRERKREMGRFLSDYGISTAFSPLSLCTCITAFGRIRSQFTKLSTGFQLRGRAYAEERFPGYLDHRVSTCREACPSASCIEKSNQ